MANIVFRCSKSGQFGLHRVDQDSYTGKDSYNVHVIVSERSHASRAIALSANPCSGSPCQRCANECPVQAIHPEGHINVNECIYCMHCQELYFDDHRCPHMIQVRLKREKRMAMSSPSMRPGGKGPNTAITAQGKPIGAAPVDAITPSAT